MVVRVDVNGDILEWARERSGLRLDDILKRFPRFLEWLSEDAKPTLKQLEAFSQATHTPIGLLLLPEVPEEQVPIPDLRTMGDEGIDRPSADLLDTLFQCERRQDWYREYAEENGFEPLAFVGSASLSQAVEQAAAEMQRLLGFEIEARGSSWTEALRRLSDKAEAAGVLVMINGVVDNNTHRPLDPLEFRGFALSDPLAPLVFVNGADTKAAQLFTLAHELAHIYLGASGLTDASARAAPTEPIERWCNEVAAEFLVPARIIRNEVETSNDLTFELDRLARRFKVSTLVVLRRLKDVHRFTFGVAYRDAYDAELTRVLGLATRDGGSGGGDFYNTQPVRTSKRFTRALVASTIDGRTPYRDAFQMLGFNKVASLQKLGKRLGVA